MPQPPKDEHPQEEQLIDILSEFDVKAENPKEAEITVLQKYLDWKAITHPESTGELREYTPIGEKILQSYPAEAQEKLKRLEAREFALKYSIASLPPAFVETIIANPALLEQEDLTSVEILKELEPKTFAIALPLEQTAKKIGSDPKYKKRLCTKLDIEDTDDKAVIHHLRERLRKNAYETVNDTYGVASSTSNWHVTGVMCGKTDEVMFKAKGFLIDTLELLEMGGDEAYEDVRMCISPYTEQKTTFEELAKTSSGRRVCGRDFPGGNIDIVNNMLSPDEKTLKQFKEKPTCLMMVQEATAIDWDTGDPSKKEYFGFIRIQHYRKGSRACVKQINLSDIKKPLEESKYTPKQITTRQMLQMQNFLVETFIPPEVAEDFVYNQIVGGVKLNNIETLSLSDPEILKSFLSSVEGNVVMPDLNSYSRIKQTLTYQFGTEPSETLNPLMKTFAELGNKYGALVDNWAGDSLRYVFPNAKSLHDLNVSTENIQNGELSPQQRSVLFSIASKKALDSFVEEKRKMVDPDFLNVCDELNELLKIRNGISRETDKPGWKKASDNFTKKFSETVQAVKVLKDVENARDKMNAMAFLATISMAEADKKGFGVKIVGVKEDKCIFHGAGLEKGRLVGTERIENPRFDALRGGFENIVRGSTMVIDKETYNLLGEFRIFFEPVENAYVLKDWDQVSKIVKTDEFSGYFPEMVES